MWPAWYERQLLHELAAASSYWSHAPLKLISDPFEGNMLRHVLLAILIASSISVSFCDGFARSQQPAVISELHHGTQDRDGLGRDLQAPRANATPTSRDTISRRPGYTDATGRLYAPEAAEIGADADDVDHFAPIASTLSAQAAVSSDETEGAVMKPMRRHLLAGDLDIDKEALLAQRNALVDPNNVLSSWTVDASPCTYRYVVCRTVEDVQRVRAVTLYIGVEGNVTVGLAGTIVSQLGSMEYLDQLSLSADRNQLSGTIPPELGSLSNLEYLSLNGWQLSGTIPPQLASLSSMKTLRLYGSRVSGTIPRQLGSLSMMNRVFLSSNLVSGTIPPELGSWSSLAWLDFSTNRLFGTIPPALGTLASLTTFELYNNVLICGPDPTGKFVDKTATWGPLCPVCFDTAIPPDQDWGCTPDNPACLNEVRCVARDKQPLLAQKAALSDPRGVLASWSDSNDVCSFQFVICTVVDGTLRVTRLIMDLDFGCQKYVACFCEDLEGTLSSELGSLELLEELTIEYVWNYHLSGTIPPELGSLSRLTTLDLLIWKNMSGTIPPELKFLSNLETLSLGGPNELSGTIPPELGSLSKLTYLSVGDTQLSGTIPPELASAPKLTAVALYNNKLVGSIPPQLGINAGSISLYLVNNSMICGPDPIVPNKVVNRNGTWGLTCPVCFYTGSSSDPDWGCTLETPYCWDNDACAVGMASLGIMKFGGRAWCLGKEDKEVNRFVLCEAGTEKNLVDSLYNLSCYAKKCLLHDVLTVHDRLPAASGCPPGINLTEPDCLCPDTINATFVMAIPLADFVTLGGNFTSEVAGRLNGLEDPSQVPGHDPVCILPPFTPLEPASPGSAPVAGPEPIFSMITITEGLLTTMHVNVQFSRPCQGVGVIRDCGPTGCQLKLGGNATLAAGMDDAHYALQVVHTETGNAEADVGGALANDIATDGLMEGSTGTFELNVRIAEGICRDALGIAGTANELLLSGNTSLFGERLENKLVVTLRYTISPSCGHGDKGYLRTAIYLGSDRVRPLLISPVGSVSEDRRVPISVDLFGEVVRPFNTSVFTVTSGHVEDSITTGSDGTWFNVMLVIDEFATATIYLDEGALYDGLSGNPSLPSNKLSITLVPANALANVSAAVGTSVKVVIGLVTVLSNMAGVLSSLGTISPAGAATASPGNPTGLLGGIGHMQTIAMVGNLPMELPDSFEKTISRWKWLNLEFLMPWRGSLCNKEEAKASVNGTTTGDSGGPTKGLQEAWAWLQDGANTAPVVITRPDESSPSASQLVLLSTACSWDIALEILFWAALLSIALLVIHKLVIVVWRAVFPDAALPDLLQFPRLELYLLIIVAPPVSQAGAFLIAVGTPISIIIGVLMLLAVPCALVGLGLYILLRRVLTGLATEYTQEDVLPPVRPAWMHPLERAWYALFGSPIEGKWEETDRNRAILARFGPLFERFKGPCQYLGQNQPNNEGSCYGRWMRWSEHVGSRLGTSYGVVDSSLRVFIAFMLGISGPGGPAGASDSHDNNGQSRLWVAWAQVSTVLFVLVIQLAIVTRRRPYIDRFMQAAETLAVACEVQLFVIITVILAEWGNKSRVGNALNVTVHLSIICNLLAQIYGALIIFIGGWRAFKLRLIQARQRIQLNSLMRSGENAFSFLSSLRQSPRDSIWVWTYANTLYDDCGGNKADTPGGKMVVAVTSEAKDRGVPTAAVPACTCVDNLGKTCSSMQQQEQEQDQGKGTGLSPCGNLAPVPRHDCSVMCGNGEGSEDAPMAAEHRESAEGCPLADATAADRDDATAGGDASNLHAACSPTMTVVTSRLPLIPPDSLNPIPVLSPPFSSSSSSAAVPALSHASKSSSSLGDAVMQSVCMPRDANGSHQSILEGKRVPGTPSRDVKVVSLADTEGFASKASGGLSWEVPLPHSDQGIASDQQPIAESRAMSVDDLLDGQMVAAGSPQEMSAHHRGLVLPDQSPSKEASGERVRTGSKMDEVEKEPGTAVDTWTHMQSEPSMGNSGSAPPHTRSIKLRVRVSISKNNMLPRIPRFLEALSSQLADDDKTELRVLKVSLDELPTRTLSLRRGYSEGSISVSKPSSGFAKQ
eukprot:jgi/Mesvir1/25949/Mv20942-RA.1